jgi:heterodisulfide reductase subunit C
MWQCVSCYACTTRCPQEIPVTDLMYSLKRLAIRAGLVKSSDASALAHVFTVMVERYGRSFEFGIATRYLLLHHPISAMRMGGLGLKMFGRGRMSLRPTRIDNVEQLEAVITEARNIGEEERIARGAQ